MATTSHTIYSFYDPEEDRARLERETGQVPSGRVGRTEDDEDPAEVWAAEASTAFKKRIAPAPRFVPATIQDGDWNVPESPPSRSTTTTPANEVSSWYKALNRTSAGGSSTPSVASTSAPSIPPSRNHTADKDTPWFIRNVVKSHPPSSASSSSSTLADILAREPPPKPTEPKFTPPVFLTIGPSNRGFTMLEKSGWNEGEALGPDIVRRNRAMEEHLRRKDKRRAVETSVKEEMTVEVAVGDDDEIKEIRKVSVVDLTLSNSESGTESGSSESEEEDEKEAIQQPPISNESTPSALSTSDRKALITPLRTVLKSDRLGIGLKAKTVGPYKESKKRVTHGAAALAAHIQASEDSQRRKRKFGKGQRGFAREYQRDQASRQAMLAYMNE